MLVAVGDVSGGDEKRLVSHTFDTHLEQVVSKDLRCLIKQLLCGRNGFCNVLHTASEVVLAHSRLGHR